MARLRGPGGCPWDHEQTLESLRQFVLEEAVRGARRDRSRRPRRPPRRDRRLHLRGRVPRADRRRRRPLHDCRLAAGDLREADPSPPARVRRRVGRRHAAARCVEQWEQIKAREQKDGRPDAVGARAGCRRRCRRCCTRYEIGTRVAAVGFDWARDRTVLDKIDEEVAELRQAVGDEGARPRRGGDGRPAVRDREPRAQAGHRAGGGAAEGQRRSSAPASTRSRPPRGGAAATVHEATPRRDGGGVAAGEGERVANTDAPAERRTHAQQHRSRQAVMEARRRPVPDGGGRAGHRHRRDDRDLHRGQCRHAAADRLRPRRTLRPALRGIARRTRRPFLPQLPGRRRLSDRDTELRRVRLVPA